MAQGAAQPIYSGALSKTRDLVKELPTDPMVYIKTIEDVEKKVGEILKDLGVDFGVVIEEFGKAKDVVYNWFSDAATTIKDIYNSVIGTTTSSATSTATPSASNVVSSTATTTVGGGGTETASTNTQPTNMNITHTFNFSNMPSYVTSTEVERILKEYTQNSQNALAMVMAAGKINAGLTTT